MQKKGNVLVIEDDASARESLKAVLKGDYEVFVASNAAQAIDVLKSVHIDTVTLEPWLPGIQGKEVLSRIRETRPQARVIIISGQQLSRWFDDMVRDEIFDFLPKPFNRRDLLRTVERSVVRQKLVSHGHH